MSDEGAVGALPSVTRFLVLAGILAPANVLVFAAVLVLAGVELFLSGTSESAPFLFLFFSPIAAGTGMLSVAREGRLDLLLGAGVSRRRIWMTAWAFSVVLPAAVIAVLEAIASRSTAGPLRAVAIALFTGGIAFAAGMVRPRYVAGVIWIGLRLAFLLSSAGLEVYTNVRASATGLPLPSAGKLAIASVAFPEFLLQPQVPVAYPAAACAIGLAALAFSLRWFEAADYAGKRTA